MTAPRKINFLLRPPWRTVVPAAAFLVALFASYWLWSPGLDVRDGRNDKSQNGIWLGHGWLGGDDWFFQNDRTNDFAKFRDASQIRELASKLRQHHIRDVFPHLCPASLSGELPSVDSAQVERFLNEFTGFRIMPWIGGPNEGSVRLRDSKWRTAFVSNVRALLDAHPRFAGVQLNVEPLPSGDTNFLMLLEELRKTLPTNKIISIAAYPPPTRWQATEDVHWSEPYFREVARRSDQLAVMMYDVGQRIPKTYVKLMSDWTTEILAWSEGKQVLLGIPTYDDAGAAYHRPNVENLSTALPGIHRGLSQQPMPTNYQGVAIYCEWETDEAEWKYFREHFLKPSAVP